MKIFKCFFTHNWGKWEYHSAKRKSLFSSQIVPITIQIKECKDCGFKKSEDV